MAVRFRDFARDRGDAVALADPRRSLTWAELDAILNRHANGLLSAKLDPPVVGVFAENGVETLIAHLAASIAGVTSVAVSRHAAAREVEYMLRDAGAQMLFASPGTADAAVHAARAVGIAEVVVWGLTEPPPGATRWEEWTSNAGDAAPPEDLTPRLMMLYTSGTTGQPKGAELPLPGGRTGESIAQHLELRSGLFPFGTKPHIVSGPLSHTGPLSAVGALCAGLEVRVLDRFDPEEWLATVERHGVGSSLMVPTHFVRLLALPEEVRSRYDVSSLEVIAHTGAACPIDVKRRMIDWMGPIFFDGYGATEVGVVTLITSPEWLEHLGSVGRTTPQFEVLVVDADGNELPPGQVGKLYFRDKSGRGIVYHNAPEKTAAAHIAPGVFTLGEIGLVDEDGYVFLTDRDSDMVISGGVNVYPAEIEQAIIEREDVRDVAVFGVPDADLGERIVALVEPADGCELSPDNLRTWCLDRLSGYKVPKEFHSVDDVGRTVMGKLNKRELREQYLASAHELGRLEPMTSSALSEAHAPLTVEIDRLACMGTGTCVQIAPEFFALRDDNRAHVVTEDIRDEGLAVAAAESCPTFAITVRRGDDFLT